MSRTSKNVEQVARLVARVNTLIQSKINDLIFMNCESINFQLSVNFCVMNNIYSTMAQVQLRLMTDENEKMNEFSFIKDKRELFAFSQLNK